MGWWMKRPNFKEKSGIYIIICMTSLKMYIGSSYNLAGRFSEHRGELRRGAHPNLHLQRAWTKYGEQAFVFGVLEYCLTEDLVSKEQEYLDKYKPYEKSAGFNLSHSSEGTRGVQITDEHKENLRQLRLGQTLSNEVKQKIRDSWKENHNVWQEQSIDRRGVSFTIMAPDGTIHEVKGLKRFAKQHGLDRSQLSRVLKGINESVQGWRLPTSKAPSPYRLLDPLGKLHIIPYGKLKGFCRENNISNSRISHLVTGRIAAYYGWTVAPEISS